MNISKRIFQPARSNTQGGLFRVSAVGRKCFGKPVMGQMKEVGCKGYLTYVNELQATSEKIQGIRMREGSPNARESRSAQEQREQPIFGYQIHLPNGETQLENDEMNNTRMKKLALSVLLGFSAMSAIAGPTVYIPLGTGNQVIAVDASTDSITTSYPAVDNPHGLVATPDGEYLVVGSLLETPIPAGSPSDTPNSKLFVVHPAHGHVMFTIPVSGWTHHQAISPDGRYVVSTHPTRGGVSVVDLQTNQVIKTVRTGPAPNYTVFTRDGKHAFVSNTGNGSISEIDPSTWEVTRALEAGPAPEHIVLSSDEKLIYSLNPMAGTVSTVSVESGKVVEAYKIGAKLHGLDLSDDGQTLFVTSSTDNKLTALDLRSGAQRELALSPAPYHLNTIPGTGKVYVSSRSDPVIWVVDQKTLKLIGNIKLPAGVAHQMAIMP